MKYECAFVKHSTVCVVLGGFRRERKERMAKILDAKKVKKLPVGTDVRVVQESTGKTGMLWVVKSGRKKMLKGIAGIHEIKDRAGWHYELPEANT